MWQTKRPSATYKGVIPLPLLGISLTPVGTKSASFSSAVTGAVHTIEERGLKYQITPTQTIIEGELDQLMDVAKEIHENAMAGTTRVITNITIDERRRKRRDLWGECCTLLGISSTQELRIVYIICKSLSSEQENKG
jgi:uncharacterized protein (TIGR00106 family)